MRTISKKIVFLLNIVLTILFIGTGWHFIDRTNPVTGTRLVIDAQIEHPGTFLLHINNRKRPVKVEVSAAGAVELNFQLPNVPVTRLTLAPGRKPGEIKVRRIVIKNAIQRKVLEGKDLRSFFHFLHKTGKGKVNANNEFSLATTGSGCWVAPAPVFYSLITGLQRDKTVWRIALFAFGGVFFFLLYYFDPAGLLRWIKKARFQPIAISIIFLILIFTPFLSWFVKGPEPQDPAEKRRLARPGIFRWDAPFEYSRPFRAFYDDHFPFRTALIRINNYLKLKLLDTSPVDRVTLGKEGWLFLNKEGMHPGTIQYYRALHPFTVAQLEQWKRVLEQRYRWLKAKGIHYLFVIVPNKNSIYPEYLPGNITKANPVNRLDQLKDYLEKHSEVPFLDLRPALLRAKRNGRLYAITDSHWNARGAYYAYREIIKRLSSFFSNAKPLPRERFHFYPEDSAGGDLAQTMLLHLRTIREEKIEMKAAPHLTFSPGEKMKVRKRSVSAKTTRCTSASLPKLLMVHDSFYKRLIPYLSESFRDVMYIWDWGMHFYPDVTERWKPQIVIDEMAERFLLTPVKKNPPQLTK